MSAKTGVFEKNGTTYQTIELAEDGDSKYRFTFGLSKARLIIRHMEEIRKFVTANKEG